MRKLIYPLVLTGLLVACPQADALFKYGTRMIPGLDALLGTRVCRSPRRGASFRPSDMCEAMVINIACNRQTKQITKAVLSTLILVLFPLTAQADGGIVPDDFVVVACSVALAIWSGLTLAFYLRLRRQRRTVRIWMTVLFFFWPALLLALALLKEELFDEHIVRMEETTQGPLAVAGATFPAGSVALYERTGSLFDQYVLHGWHTRRALLEIHISRPILLGNVRITGLRLNGPFNGFYIDLDGEQTIDGWRCVVNRFGPVMRLAPGGPELQSCWLAAPGQWRGQLVSAGSYIVRVRDSDWEWLSPCPGSANPMPVAQCGSRGEKTETYVDHSRNGFASIP